MPELPAAGTAAAAKAAAAESTESAARTAAAAALSEVVDLPIDAPAPAGVGDRFMYQDFYGGRTPEDIGKAFGTVKQLVGFLHNL
ncbi:MAG TPA: hypothetical protein PLW43_09180, partial [Chitinophagales bacterium]|nr:hypothetical protein [Chitinophagales bacterium]